MSPLKDDDVLGCIDSLTVERLDLYIARGWVAPQHYDDDRAFNEIDLARLQLIEHLRGDMALADEAVPVILSLLDQIHGLRHQLRCVGQAIELQHEAVRSAILGSLQELHSADQEEAARNSPPD